MPADEAGAADEDVDMLATNVGILLEAPQLTPAAPLPPAQGEGFIPCAPVLQYREHAPLPGDFYSDDKVNKDEPAHEDSDGLPVDVGSAP